jgi:filamentous hemagglutinin family protein
MKTTRWLSCWQLGLLGLLTSAGINAFTCKTLAQTTPSNIKPDGTLGAESSQILQNQSFRGLRIEEIRGGATRGINLFHSFLEFNVSNGRGAYFFSPSADIQNIFARVTGVNRSDILGRLGTSGNSQPNLFLINPNGIIFGKNASLDVQGSFVGTTANGLQFGNLGNFSATNPEVPPPLLTINPSALFFNQINKSAAIQNNSVARAGRDPAGFNAYGLRVPDGKSLLLVGGNVTMNGGELNAYGGRVELGGLAAPGNVNLLVNGDNLRLGFPENVTRADVSLTNEAFVYVEAAGGGDIAINARNIDILGGSELSAGIGAGLGTPETVAGDITLNATGEIKIGGRSSIVNFVQERAKGNGGNIIIDSDSFLIPDDAQLATSTLGQGNAGNVTVRAKNAVSLVNGDIFSTVEAGGVGKGGNIDINAASLSLTDGATLLTFTREAFDSQPAGQGDAGNVNVKVTGAVDIAGEKNGFSSGIRSLVATGTVGNAGNITIDSGSFSLRDGARLNASTYGQGNAGNIDIINVTGAVKISGSQDGNVSAIFTSVETGAKGNGGNITIDSGSFSLLDDARLDASTSGEGNAGNVTVIAKDAVSLVNGDIFSTVEAGGVGKGGNIDISAASLSLKDGGQLQTFTREASDTQPAGRGDAGNVNVKVTGAVDIAGEKNGFLSAIGSLVATGTVGNAGNITIDSGSFSLRDGALLSASTYGQGNAGNVTVSAKNAVSLANGDIFSAVQAGGVGKGGNIDINAATFSLTDGAQLIVSTSGQGDAGNVNVKVTGAVDIAGEKNGFSSGIRSLVATGTVGNAGNITIDSGSFSLRDGARLSASTYGQGNAGNVTVSAKDAVSLANGDIFSAVQAAGVGKGGNININAATLSLTDGAQLETLTSGQGDAGNVNVKVTGAVDIAGVKNGFSSGIRSFVDTEALGNAGNITIDSGSFSLRDGAELSASTFGQGNAGNVTVSAKDAVSLANGDIFSAVQAAGVGKGGNININAATLSLTDGAQLETLTSGQGDAGNVNVKVTGAVDIAGVKNGFSSGIRSFVDTEALGNAGNITIDSGSFSLRDGAELSASTFGQGNAGNVTVDANNAVSLAANAYIFSTVEAGGVGKGGNIDINAATLSLTDGAQLLTITRGASDTLPAGQGDAGNVNIDVIGAVTITGRTGIFPSGIRTNVEQGTTRNGGNITINSNSFSLTGGAAVVASTDGKGNAGNVTVNARESVLLRDPDNAIFSTVLENGEGKGGNIEINTKSFSLLNAAGVTAETRGQGNAGNIKINATDSMTISGTASDFIAGLYTASFATETPGKILGDTGNIEVNSPKVTLDEGGTINAESTAGNGGNINVNSDLLLLRHNSQISTTAGTAQAGGNGGNININSRFIVAVPNENSDISANAFTGAGGNIQINSQGIFGIEARPKPTEKSDITASSELGVSGVININAADTSSIQNSFAERFPNAIDANALIGQSCIVRGDKRQENTFFITGSGALNPNQPGVMISQYSTGEVRGVVATSRPWKKGDPIIEATGVYRLSNGQILLSRECSN